MIPSNRKATHPGIILLKEFLEPMELTQKALAEHIGVPIQRVNEIAKGKSCMFSRWCQLTHNE